MSHFVPRADQKQVFLHRLKLPLRDIFLLQVRIVVYSDGEHEFLDLNEKLSKLAKFAPHLWKDDVSGSIFFSILYLCT